MSSESFRKKLSENSLKVDSFIDQILKSNNPKVLYDASRHLVMSGGKRLRPFLTIQTCKAVGGNAEDAIPFAAALEILHNFTLIHDDIMDNDPIRRGSPAVHIKWGVPTAIAAGDLLFAKVYEAMTIYAPKRINCRKIRKCIEAATKATIELCEGQILDIFFPQNNEINEKDYITMVGGKTGSLFRACAEVGAIVGGAKKSQIKAIGKFSYYAGIAFQIMDDYLGIVSNEKVLGKPVGNDIREGKKTLIIIHALNHSKQKDKQKILSTLGNKDITNNQIQDIVELLKKTGSLDYSLNRIQKYVKISKKYLFTLERTPARDDLEGLVDYFTNREY